MTSCLARPRVGMDCRQCWPSSAAAAEARLAAYSCHCREKTARCSATVGAAACAAAAGQTSWPWHWSERCQRRRWVAVRLPCWRPMGGCCWPLQQHLNGVGCCSSVGSCRCGPSRSGT
ncbi:hypothetical protein H257_02635 [Aphanomyces astaci]|uniref:Uncharacterized protein n=1 Tax=Aphanomyces astaci TaxID=112090 RepID=W4H4X9_APHAT|nr:hypothetical protein H257_02635 [Aphanomyces astaci]ETV86193.1 hypothetical protein H257_02635 [Aphanomyces astaci]|eukprot:XP_009824665.1 hypothetical protein H257_02635 [Aphanomyces astaci]